MTTPRDQSTDADRAFERFRRSGDADALGAVYDELAPGLLRLAMKLLGDATAAEDVLQATFVTAIQSAERHDGARPVAPWLAGILANEVRAHRRRAARAVDPARVEPRSAPSDPSQDAIDAELDGVVRRHVRELPAAWQEPVLLRVRQGLTVPEIAATLGRPAGTIRGQIARGLARLRAGLASALGALGLARLAHRTKWEVGGRSSVAVKSVAWVGGSLMVVSLAAWIVASVVVGGSAVGVDEVAVEEPALVAAPAVEEPAARAPLVASAARPAPLAVAPAVTSPVVAAPSDDEARAIPARVVVVDGAGERVANATIDVYSDRDAYDAYAPPLRSHAADGAGVWTGELAPGEAYVARTEAARSGLWQTFEATTRVDRVVEVSELLTLSGRVVDADGELVAGCDVGVWSVGGGAISGMPRRPPEVTSDAQGRFDVDLDPGQYGVRATVGERSSLVTRVHADASPSSVTLTLPGDWRIEGRVVDARGEPVAADVRIYPDASQDFEASMGPGTTRSIRTVTSDADGRFEVRVRELGSYRVVADADGLAPSALVDVAVSVDAPVASVDLALHDTVSISGHVVDVSGAAVVGVRVVAGSGDGPGAWAADILAPRHGELFGSASTTTGARGAFVLDGLSPIGRYALTVSRGGGSAGASFSLPDIRGGADDVTIVDRGGLATTSIAGRVVEDATGEPVPHFTLNVTRERGNIQTTTRHDIDDPDGRFAVDGLDVDGVFGISVIPIEAEREVDPGGHEFPVQRTDVAPVHLPFGRLDPAGETYEFRLRRTGRVEALVLDADGAPRTFVHLMLVERDVAPDFGRHVRRAARTDETGHVVLGSVPPGVFDATVDGEPYGTVELAPGETTTVTLAPVGGD